VPLAVRRPEDTDLEAVTAAIHQFLADVEVVAAEAHDWNKDKFSQGTWMAFRPGQIMAHSAALQKPHGRIAFANSDIASGWNGWMDGGSRVGRCSRSAGAGVAARLNAQTAQHRSSQRDNRLPRWKNG
jgi:monoamine oxidase